MPREHWGPWAQSLSWAGSWDFPAHSEGTPIPPGDTHLQGSFPSGLSRGRRTLCFQLDAEHPAGESEPELIKH